MYKECVSKPAIARQRLIEQGLLEYMSHKSYEDITVLDLCEKLDIPRKAFYRYFNNKDGALYALIDHTLKDAFSELIGLQQNMLEKEEIIMHFFKFWLDKKALLDVLESNDLSGILLQRAISLTISEEAISKSLYKLHETKRARKYRTIFLISGIISLVIQWHLNHFDKTPEQMAKLAADLFS